MDQPSQGNDRSKSPAPKTPETATKGDQTMDASNRENSQSQAHARSSWWGIPSSVGIPSGMKFWESSASSRGRSAKDKEERLNAQAEKEQAKPPQFTPVWVRTVEPKKRSGEAVLLAFLTWIANQGYQVENHSVLTEDGYILNLQRIHSSYMEALPLTSDSRKAKPVVFMQHGLMDCAATWVINGRSSIGFGLADRGYDVWLGNSRGNRFSVQHKELRRSQAEFWAFDWDQMARYDLPACFEYVKKVTGQQKITYVGHSQGTTILFAGVAINPALQEHLNLFVAFCPVAYVKHQYSKMLTYMTTMKTDTVLDAFGVKSFNTPALFNSIFPGLSRLAPGSLNTAMVRMLMNAIVGFQEDNFDHNVMRDWLTFMPGGTSVRNILHWSQSSRHGNFLAYDLGKEGANMKAYGTKTPPEYDPASLTIPVVIFAGGADKLVHPNDLHRLMLKLKNVILVVEDEKFGHLDFLWGKNAREKYHNVLYEVLAARNEVPQAVHAPVLPPTAASAAVPAPPVEQLERAEMQQEKHHKRKHHKNKDANGSPKPARRNKSRSMTDLHEIKPDTSSSSDGDARRFLEQDWTNRLLANLEAEDAKDSKLLHHKHPSNVHLLLQEIRRLRMENEQVKAKYNRLEHATLSVLNHMLEQKSPLYDSAFAEVKKMIPELKEAQIRAVILQEHDDERSVKLTKVGQTAVSVS